MNKSIQSDLDSSSVLIIGPSWIGDMVIAQSLFKLLLHRRPQIHLDVLAPDWCLSVVKRMPEARALFSSPFKHGELKLWQRYHFAKKLQVQEYSETIILPNSLKSALIPFFMNIPKRTGWKGEYRWGLINDLRRLKEQQYPLMMQRFMALGVDKNEPIPANLSEFYPSLTVTEESLQRTLEKLRLKLPQKPILALCPGAEYGPAKRWPIEYFASLAEQRISEGWEVWLFGSKQDQLLGQRLMELTEFRCTNLIGQTDLENAIDLLSVVTVVVSNDSGLMHIAAALKRPLVVLYGSTSPHFTPPLTDKVKILKTELACSPCFKRECPLQHFKCMKEMLPRQVNNLVDELML